jgi:hypothetical protein
MKLEEVMWKSDYALLYIKVKGTFISVWEYNQQVHLRYVNLLYMSKISYMFRPRFMDTFSEMLYEGYVTKTSQTMCQYKILSFKYCIWFKIYHAKITSEHLFITHWLTSY